MEIISVMMTLIIFLFVISLLIMLFVFYKIKVKIKIAINEEKIDAIFEIMNKKYNKFYNLKELNIYALILEKLSRNRNVKQADMPISKVDNLIIEVRDITSFIEIDYANISFIVGTPFIALTIFSNITLSTLIPVVYQKLFMAKGRLNYKVIPEYNKFKFVGNIEGTFFITSFRILLIYIWLKKNNKEKKKEEIR